MSADFEMCRCVAQVQMLLADIHLEITNFKTNNGYGEVGYLISKFLSDFIFDKCELVTHSCLTLRNPMDYSPRPPGFSVFGILQARILEWVLITFSRGSS